MFDAVSLSKLERCHTRKRFEVTNKMRLVKVVGEVGQLSHRFIRFLSQERDAFPESDRAGIIFRRLADISFEIPKNR